jgi:hypothetical protein
MANRLFNADIQSLDTAVRKLYGRVTFGATSAIASQDSNGLTISALGTGTFDVQLGVSAARPDTYALLLNISFTPLCSAAGDTGWQVIEQTVATDGTFSIRNAPAGAAAHPVNGTSLYIEVTLRNSATSRKGT